MRFQNYLNDSYIGIVEKNQEADIQIKKDRKVNNLLKELNNYLLLHTNYETMRFDIVNEFHSPSEKLENIDNKKLEKLTRKWMKLSEQFEELKDNYKKSLQDI